MAHAKNIFLFVGFLYFVYVLDLVIPLSRYGIVPRTQRGLIGIVSCPFLHANLRHLVSNTVPLTILLFVLYSFYPNKAMSVVVISIVLGGILVWLFGRNANHIGASGLIYGLAAFLIVNGFTEQKFVPILISIAVAVVYGSLFWGIFPSYRTYVSWEGHLFGALAGFAAVFLLKGLKNTIV
ncbi:rhomboid family intramembrane serine protease [Wenyingzhuangia sp. 1_MG-2023]|nr:rhomboid family intramembrane serine protease [Wenyingzhuangia sp. 1_MG-2023]